MLASIIKATIRAGVERAIGLGAGVITGTLPRLLALSEKRLRPGMARLIQAARSPAPGKH